ncbi:MAG: hypothetical protein JKY66_09640 [Spongiibacteraceae bacterium]|nr:hypothetical protein [Spongiibacteraceae bacterium]
MYIPEFLEYSIKENDIVLSEYCAIDKSFSTQVTLVVLPDLDLVRETFEGVGYSVLQLNRLDTIVCRVEMATVRIQKSGRIHINNVRSRDHSIRILSIVIGIISSRVQMERL